MDQNKTTLLCAIVSGLVAVLVAYITSGATFKQQLSANREEVVKLRQDLQSVNTSASSLAQQVASLSQARDELKRQVNAIDAVKKDLAATSTQASTLRQDVATLASQIPKSYKPAANNCKAASETYPAAGEPNVCGNGYLMTGINHDGKTVCCTLEAIR